MIRGVMNGSSANLILAVAIAVANLAGCGSSDDDKAFDEFVGTWQFTESTVTEMCAGVPPEALTVTGINQTLDLGVTSDLVSVGLFADPCNFRFDVEGKQANMLTDMRCSFNEDDYYQPTSGRFTLLSATEAEEAAELTGKITFQSAQGLEQLDCTLSVAGKLVKIARR